MIWLALVLVIEVKHAWHTYIHEVLHNTNVIARWMAEKLTFTSKLLRSCGILLSLLEHKQLGSLTYGALRLECIRLILHEETILEIVLPK